MNSVLRKRMPYYARQHVLAMLDESDLCPIRTLVPAHLWREIVLDGN